LDLIVEEKKQKGITTKDSFSFKVADDLQWRAEKFGATLFGNSMKTRMFLNHEGLEVFLQLHKGEVYTSDDPRILWGEVSPPDFLFILLKKGGIKILKKGGDNND